MTTTNPQIVRFYRKGGHHEVVAHVNWETALDPEVEMWVGVCDSLNLVSQGRTHEDCIRRSTEIVGEFLKILYKEGSLPDFLTDMGWELKVELPQGVSEDDIRFDVPTSFSASVACAH